MSTSTSSLKYQEESSNQRRKTATVDGDCGSIDAGNGPNDHYKNKLSPFRYKLRSTVLPLVRYETNILLSLQSKLRNPFFDAYFAWTANLGSHTFYVFMLPLPIWFGAEKLSRDLIAVLGLGIFFSGSLKDYMCLPRPRSPPLHRITMSSYTTQEYGFPSSHSANATAVTLVLWKHFQESQSFSSATQYVLYFVLALYCISLVFGRVYCGMHGFIDCITGSLIGYVLFCFRYYLGSAFDFIVLTKLGWATPVLVSIAYILLIHFHSEPVDDCPCFDDSVAFIGVLIGIDICDWWLLKTTGSYAIPYDFETLGVGKSFLRVVIGVVLVAVWKSISKPIIFTILPPIYKIVGVYLPRRNFEATAFLKKTTRQIRSQSISNMNLQEQDIIGGTSKDVIGPSDDIDIYEMIDYEREKHKNDEKFKKIPFPSTEASTNIPSTSTESENKVSGVFRPRYDVEIVGRLFVYAGVATFALWGFAQAIKLTNLCA